jgi:hypothetical protein
MKPESSRPLKHRDPTRFSGKALDLKKPYVNVLFVVALRNYREGIMIVWRGWGGLVALLVFLSSLIANFLSNILGGTGYWESHSLPLASALFFAGGLIWVADSYFSKKPARTLVDEKTGERVLLTNRNDFFFIRMRWWGLISAGSGILILITNTVPGIK